MSDERGAKGKQAPPRKGRILRYILRGLIALLAVAATLAVGLWMIMDEVFNGPSETARNRLTMSLLEASAT